MAACAATLTAGPLAEAAVPPAGRAYELVSPAAKNGNDVNAAFRSTADGDAVWFGATSSFPGQPGAVLAEDGYVARRTAGGWVTRSITPPPLNASTTLMDTVSAFDVTDDLGTYIAAPFAALAAGDQNAVQDVYRHRPGETTAWVSAPATLPDASAQNAWYAGRSADGRTIVFESDRQVLADVPGGTRRVYAWTDGTTRLVSRLPDGTPAPNAQLGNGLAGSPAAGGERYGGPPERRAVSRDGDRILFASGGTLYSRTGESPSVPISLSERAGAEGTPGAGVIYRSASSDGARVIFTSTSQLTDDATPGGGLYAYDLEAGSGGDHLTFLSTGSTDPGGAAVQGVVRVSEDARRVYFVARDVLVSGEGTPTARNLYLSDHGSVRFVATLAPADTPLWAAAGATGGEDYHPARVTADGGRLLFASRADIGGHVVGGRTQLHLYDAGASSLTCISCRPDGGPATAVASLTDSASDGSTGFLRSRNLTADGERAYFETKERLHADDTDAHSDVYEWDGTGARLLSPETPDQPVQYIDNSADGSTVFVRTRARLIADDSDGGNIDVYAVRAGGGFPAGAGPGCEGTACRGPRTPAPGLVLPASTTFAGAGNLAEFPSAPAAPTLTAARLSAAALARWGRTGRVSIRATLGASGTIRAIARAKLGGKTATVARDAARLRRPGSAVLRLKLSRRARRELRRAGRLRLTLALTASSTSSTTTSVVVLRSHGGAS